MRAPIWKIQVTQSSNSKSCCKNGQVPLELFFEVHIKGHHVALRSIWKLRKQVILSLEEKTPVEFNMGPQALHRNNHILLFAQVEWFVFYTYNKISRWSKPSIPAPSGSRSFCAAAEHRDWPVMNIHCPKLQENSWGQTLFLNTFLLLHCLF